MPTTIDPLIMPTFVRGRVVRADRVGPEIQVDVLTALPGQQPRAFRIGFMHGPGSAGRHVTSVCVTPPQVSGEPMNCFSARSIPDAVRKWKRAHQVDDRDAPWP